MDQQRNRLEVMDRPFNTEIPVFSDGSRCRKRKAAEPITRNIAGHHPLAPNKRRKLNESQNQHDCAPSIHPMSTALSPNHSSDAIEGAESIQHETKESHHQVDSRRVVANSISNGHHHGDQVISHCAAIDSIPNGHDLDPARSKLTELTELQQHFQHLYDMEASFEVEMAEIMQHRKMSLQRRIKKHYQQILRLRDGDAVVSNTNTMNIISAHNQKLGKIQRKYRRNILKLLERNSNDIGQIQGDFHRGVLGKESVVPALCFIPYRKHRHDRHKKKRKKRSNTCAEEEGHGGIGGMDGVDGITSAVPVQSKLPPLPLALQASLNSGVKAVMSSKTDHLMHEGHAALLRDLRDLEGLRDIHGDDTEVDSIPTPEPKPLPLVEVKQKKKRKRRKHRKKKSGIKSKMNAK